MKIQTHISLQPKPATAPPATLLRCLLALLVAVAAPTVRTQCQDYSGSYYIGGVGYNAASPANNFYLCPTEGWCFYVAAGSVTGTDNGQPFLTTYKCRDGVYDLSKAEWYVKKHPTEPDCYYIIQRTTGRYMVSNATMGTDANRMRVHLESVADPSTLDDMALFEITQNGDFFELVPHATAGRNGDSFKYIVVNNGNKNQLTGESSKVGGPAGYTSTGGILGLYNAENNRKFYLEPMLSTTITQRDDNTVDIACAGATAIYYTTDGSTPDPQHAGGANPTKLYTGPFAMASAPLTVKAIAVKAKGDGEALDIYSPINSTVIDRYIGPDHHYAIQSVANTDFFLIPAETLGGNITVNTTSLAQPRMVWTVKNAGSDGGQQYYYIVNHHTGQYLYRSETNLYAKDEADFSDSDDDFKFLIAEAASGYNLVPKNNNTKSVYKADHNKADVANANGGKSDTRSCWNLVAMPGDNLPAAMRAEAPFNLSADGLTYYYKIGSAAASGYYVVPPTGAVAYASTSDVTVDGMAWHFEAAGSDQWLDYYYIVNPTTGQYLYYTGNIVTDIQANAFITQPLGFGEADRYCFAVAKTTTSGQYYLVPRVLRYLSQNKYMLVWRDNGNPLKTTSNREGSAYRWTFTTTDLFCLPPVITQAADGTVSIKCPTTASANIYYTTDGTTPTSASTLYTAPFAPAIGAESVKAVAIVTDGTNSASSDVTTFNFGQLATPIITYDYITGKLSITTVVPGATIYATTDGSTPTSSMEPYSEAFSLDGEITIKAFAEKGGFTQSELATLTVSQLPLPTIEPGADGSVAIKSSVSGVTIYYTTDGSDPTYESAIYTRPLVNGVSGHVVKAIAAKVNSITSGVATTVTPVVFACAEPVIYRESDNRFTLSCNYPAEGVSIYYTTNGTTPTSGSTRYTGTQVAFSPTVTVKAIAIADGYNSSEVATEVFGSDIQGSGTDVEPFIIASTGDYDLFVAKVNSGTATGYYKVTRDIAASSRHVTGTFSGVFDGGLHTISGLTAPLFATVSNAVVKNVMLKNVAINSGTNVGAICGEASGYTRIYNCGILPSNNKFEGEVSSISGSNYVGGLVGWLKDDSRTINCFSFATIAGGATVAGIVGYNDVASNANVSGGKYSNLRTMVMNCMFYGNITGGTQRYPVYGGKNIVNNAVSGINNYNYYRTAANVGTLTNYNCSWPADEQNLTQFEYYRSMLNSNRGLGGWWVKSNVAPSTLTTAEVQAIDKDASLMAKWVLDPSVAPYPILKADGKYATVINYDPERVWNADRNEWLYRTEAGDYEGKNLGFITVVVKAGSNHTADDIMLALPITDMDAHNHDYSYGKVQLPYYNEQFGDPDGATWAAKYADNYTSKVVTGWDITAITGGVPGTFSSDVITGNAFADRSYTCKDLYSVGGRVFAQGGYYCVPEGVTAIEITAHWADAHYLGNVDGSVDRVNMKSAKEGKPFAPAGTRSATFGGQTVHFTTIQDMLESHLEDAAASVYDCAIVLVGNYQYRNSSTAICESSSHLKPFTLMTVDLDFDNEPDYCLEWQIGEGTTRAYINPVRFDFLPVVNLGHAMKEHDSKNLYTLGKLTPYGHFELTETAYMHLGQFEYEDGARDQAAPLILLNGYIDQFNRGSNTDNDQNMTYFLLGGRLKMAGFTPGAHVRSTANKPSRHCAVNVMGGEYAKFYLTGNYNNNVTPTADNPHAYIIGGKMDFVASAAKEGINGDVYWKIEHALIGEFYGGGITADKVVTGNISVTINHSRVDKFCGGPMFGDMGEGKTVTTRATGTTFGVYYGAGNGGTNYMQYISSDNTATDYNTYDWEGSSTGNLQAYTPLNYINEATGYHAKYELEMINSSAGTSNDAINRTYMYAAQFATTNTGAVSSILTDCTVLTNYYGAGNLGGVLGDVTSVLDGYTVVAGNVYGAGFSAQIPTVDVYPKSYTPPSRNQYTSVITPPSYAAPTTYVWTNETSIGGTELSTSSPSYVGAEGQYLYTGVPLQNLGTVQGTVALTIGGDSRIGTAGNAATGHVFGGGEESKVEGSTQVTLTGNVQVLGSVYGGGNHGAVNGNVSVVVE